MIAYKSNGGSFLNDFLTLVYDELRKLAAAKMAAERPGQTLEATALVHEAYIRLVGPDGNEKWNGQSHFFGAAAEAMRRILVDNARRKKTQKHGGDHRQHTLADPEAPQTEDELLELDEALAKLAEEDTKAARVVEMRHEEIATALGITVYRARHEMDFASLARRDATITLP